MVINFWEKKCPITEGIAFTIPGPDKTKALFWEAKLDHYGQSVDHRVKFAGWMKEFAKRGGNLVIQDAGPREIDGYGKSYDLVLVAAGKGEINRMFERDEEKSPYDRPMRALALTYVKNMVPRKPFDAVSFNLVPGVGEYFVFPALTTTGPCEIMVFEGVPGGPMDCWNDVIGNGGQRGGLDGEVPIGAMADTPTARATARRLGSSLCASSILSAVAISVSRSPTCVPTWHTLVYGVISDSVFTL